MEVSRGSAHSERAGTFIAETSVPVFDSASESGRFRRGARSEEVSKGNRPLPSIRDVYHGEYRCPVRESQVYASRKMNPDM